jgi:antitoxin component YwqK of YwqJK toxin-antitoxin module
MRLFALALDHRRSRGRVGGMKKLLLIVCGISLLAGCGDGGDPDSVDLEDPSVRKELSEKAISYGDLQMRKKGNDNLFFAPGEDSPYSGWVKEQWGAGHDKSLRHFKEGKQDGPYTRWYENKKKKESGHFKNGMQDGQRAEWYENGQKKEEGNFKDGQQDGVWVTYRDGKELYRQTFKDGKEVQP